MERKTVGTVSYLAGQMDNTVPSIKIAGKWLKEFGFVVGDKLNLTTENGKVVIERAEANILKQ